MDPSWRRRLPAAIGILMDDKYKNSRRFAVVLYAVVTALMVLEDQRSLINDAIAELESR